MDNKIIISKSKLIKSLNFKLNCQHQKKALKKKKTRKSYTKLFQTIVLI